MLILSNFLLLSLLHHSFGQRDITKYNTTDFACEKDEDCIEARLCKKTTDLLQGTHYDVQKAQMQYCDIWTKGKRKNDVVFGHSLKREKGRPLVCCKKSDRIHEVERSYCSSYNPNLRLKLCGRSPVFYLSYAAKAYLLARDRYARLPNEGCNYTKLPTTASPDVTLDTREWIQQHGFHGRRKRTEKSKIEAEIQEEDTIRKDLNHESDIPRDGVATKEQYHPIGSSIVSPMDPDSNQLHADLKKTKRKATAGEEFSNKGKSRHRRKKRIAGGHPARIGQFPFLVSVYYTDIKTGKEYTYECMGTIIHHKLILTTKNCVLKGPIKAVVVGEYGINSTSDKGHLYQVINDLKYLLKPPPQRHSVVDYKANDVITPKKSNSSIIKVYDVAMMKIRSQFRFNDFVQPVCIPLPDSPNNMIGNFSGPAIALGHGIDSPHLLKNKPRFLKVQIDPHEKCQDHYSNELLIPYRNGEPTIICAGGTRDEGDCPLEEGSPLLVRNDEEGTFFQVGVLNEQIRKFCRISDRPPVYLNLVAHAEFLKEAMEALLDTDSDQDEAEKEHQCLSDKERKAISG